MVTPVRSFCICINDGDRGNILYPIAIVAIEVELVIRFIRGNNYCLFLNSL